MLLDYIKDNGLKCAVATSTQKSSAEKSLHRIAAMSVILPSMEDMHYRVRKRIVGNIAGVICRCV